MLLLLILKTLIFSMVMYTNDSDVNSSRPAQPVPPVGSAEEARLLVMAHPIYRIFYVSHDSQVGHIMFIEELRKGNEISKCIFKSQFYDLFTKIGHCSVQACTHITMITVKKTYSWIVDLFDHWIRILWFNLDLICRLICRLICCSVNGPRADWFHGCLLETE